MALKRLMTSTAAIAIFGCSSSTDENVPSPAFMGSGVDAVNAAEQAPADGSGDPAMEDEDGAQAPAGDRSEGQGSEDVRFESLQPVASDAEASGEVAGEDAPTTEEEPVVEEEPELVRPELDCNAPPPQLLGGVATCDVNGLGTVAGQDYFLWYNGSGGGCMTAYDNLAGAFSANWNNPGDFLARLGFWFDETVPFEEVGEIGADFAFTRQGSGGGFNYIGMYGWTVDPVLEYYVVEDDFFDNDGPRQPFNTQLQGSYQADGAQYNIYAGTRVNAPNITGEDATFIQVFSVRQSPRQCGHISLSEHFRQWQQAGIEMGLAKEAKVTVEVGNGGDGSITFHHANLSITPPGE